MKQTGVYCTGYRYERVRCASLLVKPTTRIATSLCSPRYSLSSVSCVRDSKQPNREPRKTDDANNRGPDRPRLHRTPSSNIHVTGGHPVKPSLLLTPSLFRHAPVLARGSTVRAAAAPGLTPSGSPQAVVARTTADASGSSTIGTMCLAVTAWVSSALIGPNQQNPALAIAMYLSATSGSADGSSR
jgi:hypothetical protein